MQSSGQIVTTKIPPPGFYRVDADIDNNEMRCNQRERNHAESKHAHDYVNWSAQTSYDSSAANRAEMCIVITQLCAIIKQVPEPVEYI